MNVTSLRRAVVPAAAALTISLSLAACSAGSSTTINGAGSTAQAAAQAAWTKAFQTANSDVTVNYAGVGSGGGVTKFLAGDIDFAGTDSALSADHDGVDEIAGAEKRCGAPAIEVPNYISAIAVAYNVPGVSDLKLDAPTLAGIFNGSIKTWNAPAIANLNKGTKLPSTAIVPVHRSDKSGTTKNFTDYLEKASGGAWKSEADSVWPSNDGEAANGTSGVAKALTAAGAIGYLDDSAAQDLSKAQIKVGDAFVSPSAETASKDVEVSEAKNPADSTYLALSVEREPKVANAYPITLVSYLIACPTYAKDKVDNIKNYLLSIVSTAGQDAAAAAAGSAPLPANYQAQATKLISAITAK